MKKFIAWLCLATSFCGMSSMQAMQAPGDEITRNELKKIIHRIVDSHQDSITFKYTKKIIFYTSVGVAIYLGIRKIIGMPSLAHVKSKINGLVVTTKKNFQEVFDTTGKSLAGLQHRFSAINKRTNNLSTTLNNFTSRIKSTFEKTKERINNYTASLLASKTKVESTDDDLEEKAKDLTNEIKGIIEQLKKNDKEINELIDVLYQHLFDTLEKRQKALNVITQELRKENNDDETENALKQLQETIRNLPAI